MSNLLPYRGNASIISTFRPYFTALAAIKTQIMPPLGFLPENDCETRKPENGCTVKPRNQNTVAQQET
jgi:hypothetical protein